MSCLGCLNHRRWSCFMEIMLQLGLKEEILAHASQDCKWFLIDVGVTREVAKWRGPVLFVLQGRDEPCLNTCDCYVCKQETAFSGLSNFRAELTLTVIKKKTNQLLLLINMQWTWAICKKVLYSTFTFTLLYQWMYLVPRHHCLKLFVVSLGDTLEF